MERRLGFHILSMLEEKADGAKQEFDLINLETEEKPDVASLHLKKKKKNLTLKIELLGIHARIVPMK